MIKTNRADRNEVCRLENRNRIMSDKEVQVVEDEIIILISTNSNFRNKKVETSHIRKQMNMKGSLLLNFFMDLHLY